MSDSSKQQRLLSSPLDIGQLTLSLYDNEAGAVATFIGTTRRTNGPHTIRHLVYEAYESMAERQLLELEIEILNKFKAIKAVAVHRLGIVGLQEPSVFLGVSAPRRRIALDACSFAIESLKKNLAVWKKEVTESGEELWIANDCTLPQG